MKHLPQAPTIVKVEMHEGRLYGVAAGTPSGNRVPIYRFAALQAAIHSGQGVPYASHWPEHLKLFIYSYSPLPVLSSKQLPYGLEPEFAERPRPEMGLRPWRQATFRGWPLYVHARTGNDSAAWDGSVTHLFDQVNMKLLSLPSPGSCELGP